MDPRYRCLMRAVSAGVDSIRTVVMFTVLAVIGPTLTLEAQEPGSQAFPTVDLPLDVERVLRDYEQAWTGGDSRGLADLFTQDGFALRPRRPPVRGHAAILRTYENVCGNLALRALDFAVSDSIGYIVGAFAAEPGDPDIGKFVLLLRRGPSGRWLIVADIDNGNQ